MPIPSAQELMLPLLQLTQDGIEHKVSELGDTLSRQFSLTPNELAERLSSGQLRFANRVVWVTVYLTMARLLDRVSPGVFRITDRGREHLAKNPEAITVRDLRQYEEFRQFQPGRSNKSLDANRDNPPPEVPQLQTPEERIQEAFRELEKALAAELLERLRTSPPSFFERAVIRLLVAMGYGGSLEDAEQVGRSGDGGIDGVIKEDKLGLDRVYVQAKRWNGQAVGSAVVREFIGSLAVRKARKGVLLTTSSFTRDAKDCVANLEQRVVLIDGDTLAALMIEHDTGVTTVTAYSVKKIDSDFFVDA